MKIIFSLVLNANSLFFDLISPFDIAIHIFETTSILQPRFIDLHMPSNYLFHIKSALRQRTTGASHGFPKGAIFKQNLNSLRQ